MFQNIFRTLTRGYSNAGVSLPLRSRKSRSERATIQKFLDLKNVQVVGGNGGDGCASFLHLWSNELAGPDGGDGGNGGHVIFKGSVNVTDLSHINTILRAEGGEKGHNKDCNGKNAEHLIIEVPIGTVLKNSFGKVVCDLAKDGMMFVAARGGAGGKGNHFFITDTQQAPEICEYGGAGENLSYTMELRSIAHIGLIGFPNVGKSTLLRAVSRARPKVAPYPFTTLKPHIGIIQYDDYEQIAVADLPGLIPNSHKNRGLGFQFLKHAERCSALLYVIDMSLDEPWDQLQTLQYELSQFNANFLKRPCFIIANKMDLPDTDKHLKLFKQHTELPIIPVSAKQGLNLSELLVQMRFIYDEYRSEKKDNE